MAPELSLRARPVSSMAMDGAVQDEAAQARSKRRPPAAQRSISGVVGRS